MHKVAEGACLSVGIKKGDVCTAGNRLPLYHVMIISACDRFGCFIRSDVWRHVRSGISRSNVVVRSVRRGE